jgi:hypothetical protein
MLVTKKWFLMILVNPHLGAQFSAKNGWWCHLNFQQRKQRERDKFEMS